VYISLQTRKTQTNTKTSGGSRKGQATMRTKKCEIWMNGKYLETCRDREAAELRVEHYKRQDAHEEQTGYTPVKTTYEIKPR